MQKKCNFIKYSSLNVYGQIVLPKIEQVSETVWLKLWSPVYSINTSFSEVTQGKIQFQASKIISNSELLVPLIVQPQFALLIQC